MSEPEQQQEQQLCILERRLKREKQARQQAEKLLTEKSVALFDALQSSQSAQKKLELALWASQESYWEWMAQSDTFQLRSFSLRGQSESVWQGSPIDLLSQVHEDDITTLEFHWTLAVHGGRDRVEIAFRFKTRESFQWMRLRGRVLERDKHGSALHVVGTTKDITRERKAEQSFHLMASAFSSSREPMLVLSESLEINECNDAFLQLVQLYSRADCIHRPLSAFLLDPEDNLDMLRTGLQVRFESVVTNANGEKISVDVSIARFETQHQSSSYLIATLRDISERKSNEARLQRMALHDDLTGLRNRNGLRDTLEQVIKTNKQFILAFIDLDGFKQINDTAGHEQGDAVLKRIADLLTDEFTFHHQVTRWGGDEFVIAMTGMTLDQARDKCSHIIDLIESISLDVQGTELRLSASIGIAEYPLHGESIDTLIQNADAAMYQAKTTGKGRVNTYQEGLLESIKERVSLLSDLRRAVNHHALDFYIQGKYDGSGVLKGGEVLCRWHSSLHGMVSPAVFIPLAEAHQFDSDIGLQALEAACDYISMMETQGVSIPLSINISANQLLDKEFASRAAAICHSCDIATSMIEIEITESIFMRDERSAVRSLESLREAGFSLALDDFGTGFSSISYLRKFQFQVVKVDRSLIRDIHHDSKALSLLKGVLAMLQGLRLDVVVEGVESESYIPLLQDCDVDLMQGFYFDRPMPFEQFMARQHAAGTF